VAGKQNQMAMIGSYAFIAGFVLAVLVGLSIAFGILSKDLMGLAFVVLAIVGLVVSILNISDKEVNGYLVAAIALIVSANGFNVIGSFLDSILPTMSAGAFIAGFMSAVIAFVAPATLFTALKAVYAITKDY